MCQSIADGGQRCFSHTNAEYQDALKKLETKETELDASRRYLQNVKMNIERLDNMWELGEISDESYNKYLDEGVAVRKASEEKVRQNQEEVNDLSEKVKNALSEVRTTKTGLANLKQEMNAETNILEKRRLKLAYDSGQRFRIARKNASDKFKERYAKGLALREEANTDMEFAKNLPEYSPESRMVKNEAILEAHKKSAQAYLEMNNGREVFPALFDQKGNLVPAKVVPTREGKGRAWGLLKDPKDPSSPLTGFVTISQSKDPKKREEFYASKGFTVGKVWAEAAARITTDANGVKKVSIQRTDGGYSPFAQTVTLNQYKK